MPIKIDTFDPNGDEFKKLPKYIQTYPINVIVYDTNDEIIREITMDFGYIQHKKWLGALSHWAWEQGYTVETKKAVE